MDVSRRKFLGAFSATIAALLSFGGIAEGGSLRRLLGHGAPTQIPDALSQLGWSSFYENLYTDFEFSSPQVGRQTARPARLRLTAMKDEDRLRKNASDNGSRCFVLTFSQSSRAAPLRQDTYTVDHFALGRFDLFISDASVTEGGNIYTAVINRIVG